jgi:uncharacterized protein VirK/YbjX
MDYEISYQTLVMLVSTSGSLDSLDVLLAGIALGASGNSAKSEERQMPKANAPTWSGKYRSMSWFELLRWFCQVSRLVHPGVSLRVLKRKAFFIWRCMRWRDTLKSWYGGRTNSSLSREIALRPMLLALVEHPYLCSDWSAAERMRTVEMHYRVIESGRSLLCFAPQDRVQLLERDQIPPGIQLVLEKCSWLMWEGEVVISLFEDTMRRYSLAFSLGSINGETVAYVGGLQGGGADNMIEIYRALTHALHGMRPRDFLFTSFRLLCRQLGVQRILAVSDRARLHRNPYFKNKVGLFSDYDAIWKELGGVPLGNGFFDIGVPVVYREPADIPTRKRAQYRRRYAMLDGIAADIKRVCNPSLSDSGCPTRSIEVINASVES